MKPAAPLLSLRIGACGTVLAASTLASQLRPSSDAAMRMLPFGSVMAEGRLLREMEKQRDGLTGHGEELYDDIGKSDWLTNAGRGGEYAWERGPYYARGLIALALILDDSTLKARASKWIDAALASQRPDGDFGPKRRNWWANMLVLSYLRDWAESTDDGRIVPFLEKYFDFQMRELTTFSFADESCWAFARGGDEADVVLWLATKMGDRKWTEFARRILDMTADWTDYYRFGGDPSRKNGYRSHIVNFMQGLKTPALKYAISGSKDDFGACAAAFAPDGWAMRQCGRPDAMLNGSEPLTDRSASGGTELCAIAERIISCGCVLERTGVAAAADDMEDVAYNALPATIASDGKGIRYYLMLNQPMCVDKGLMFANNGFGAEVSGANCLGPHSGFGCCRSNWHVAWPKFVQSMWMRKEDGIAAVLHGASSVSTRLECGDVVLREETEYPYSGRVRIRIVRGSGRFPVFVRVPRWAKIPDAGTFRRYMNEWHDGDVIDIDFPMDTEVSFWGSNAVSIRRGPLIYALEIGEKWKRVEEYQLPYGKGKTIKDANFPRWEILPTTPWNYALLLNKNRKPSALEVVSSRRIKVKAVRTEFGGWGFMRTDAPGRAIDPPESPLGVTVASGDVEIVSLVPLADTQLRITLFPWVSRRLSNR